MTCGDSQLRALGKTGLRVPPIVFGTSCLGNLYQSLPDSISTPYATGTGGSATGGNRATGGNPATGGVSSGGSATGGSGGASQWPQCFANDTVPTTALQQRAPASDYQTQDAYGGVAMIIGPNRQSCLTDTVVNFDVQDLNGEIKDVVETRRGAEHGARELE